MIRTWNFDNASEEDFKAMVVSVPAWRVRIHGVNPEAVRASILPRRTRVHF